MSEFERRKQEIIQNFDAVSLQQMEADAINRYFLVVREIDTKPLQHVLHLTSSYAKDEALAVIRFSETIGSSYRKNPKLELSRGSLVTTIQEVQVAHARLCEFIDHIEEQYGNPIVPAIWIGELDYFSFFTRINTTGERKRLSPPEMKAYYTGINSQFRHMFDFVKPSH